MGVHQTPSKYSSLHWAGVSETELRHSGRESGVVVWLCIIQFPLVSGSKGDILSTI